MDLFNNEVFSYILLPLLIFLARVADVTLATIRIIFVMSGKRVIAPILGFFESLLWLLAIGQIIQNIDNAISYVAYAGGFATGTFVGMYIEEKLAIGRVVVRIITKNTASELIEFFKENEYGFSNLDAEGRTGKVNVLFTVVKRDRLKELIPKIHNYNPHAFYTIESVKSVNSQYIDRSNNHGIGFWFSTLKRK